MRAAALAIASLFLTMPAVAQDKATIQKLNENFASALAKGDFTAVAGMYAENAYLLPPGSPMISGRAQIQAFWTKAAEGIDKIALTVVDVAAFGDAAREVGTFLLTTKASPPQQIAGKYVVVWQKAGSDWKLTTDIWNTDK